MNTENIPFARCVKELSGEKLRFEFLSQTDTLVKLVIDHKNDCVVASMKDCCIDGFLTDLNIFSNTFNDEREDLHWISIGQSRIYISEEAFSYLSKQDLLAEKCQHSHYHEE